MANLSQTDARNEQLIAALGRVLAARKAGRQVAYDDLVLVLDDLTREAVTVFSDRTARRLMLRQIKADHYSGMSPTAAAKLIAVAWGRWRPGEPAPAGTQAAFFARMAMRGIAPRGWRTIADDLDASFDRGRK
jgi:hypothetical protein